MPQCRLALIGVLAWLVLAPREGTAGTVFSDDFNRPDSTTVGNGWIEAEAAPGDAQILGTQLNFSGSGGTIHRPPAGDAGNSNLTMMWQWTTAIESGTESAVYARYPGTAGGNGLYCAWVPRGGQSDAIYLVDSTGYLAIHTGALFTPNTAYQFRWDIGPDNSMSLWLWASGSPMPTTSILNVGAFTPVSIETNWAIGGAAGNVLFDRFVAFTPAGTTFPPVIAGPIVNPSNGHTYYLLAGANWTDSETEAVSLGGHLATIRSQAENDFITTNFDPSLGPNDNFWIGLNNFATSTNTFVWVSGEAAGPYAPWSAGNPDNLTTEYCVHVIGPGDVQRGLWNNNLCSNLMDGVVEVTPPSLPFIDDFNRPDAAIVGNDWSEYEPSGSAAIQSDTLLITSNGQSGSGAKVFRPLPQQTNLRVTGRFTMTAYFTRLWVLVRADGPTSLRNGYGFNFRLGINDTQLNIADNATDSIDGNSIAGVNNLPLGQLNEAVDFDMLLFADNSIEVRLWDATTGSRPGAPTLASPAFTPTAPGSSLALVEATRDATNAAGSFDYIQVDAAAVHAQPALFTAGSPGAGQTAVITRIDLTTGHQTLLTTFPGFGSAIACGPDGKLYVSQSGSGCCSPERRIMSLNLDGTGLSTVLDFATTPELMDSAGPTGLVFASDGTLFFDAQTGASLPSITGIWKLPPGSTTPVQVVLPFARGTYPFVDAEQIAFLTSGPYAGNLIAADYFGGRVVRIAPPFDSAQDATDFITGLDHPSGLAQTPDGTLYVSAYHWTVVDTFAADGTSPHPLNIQANYMHVDSLGNLYLSPATGVAASAPVIRIAPDGTRTSLGDDPSIVIFDAVVCPDASTTPACSRDADCDDHNACTVNRCVNGACDFSQSVSCDDNNICTTDSCDPASGCMAVSIPGCCETDDTCDTDACTLRTCDLLTHTCSVLAIPYDDSGIAVIPVPDTYSLESDNARRIAKALFCPPHTDAYQFITVFTSYPANLGGVFSGAGYDPVANKTTGLGNEPFDCSCQYNSSKLEGIVEMGPVSQYPPDPRASFTTYCPRAQITTLDVLGEEIAHRWGAYVTFTTSDRTIVDSDMLLGREFAHWSFFFNSSASVLEGNRWTRAGATTYRSTAVTEGYSPLDLYLMGLLRQDEVPGFFYLAKGGTAPDRLAVPATIPFGHCSGSTCQTCNRDPDCPVGQTCVAQKRSSKEQIGTGIPEALTVPLTIMDVTRSVGNRCKATLPPCSSACPTASVLSEDCSPPATRTVTMIPQAFVYVVKPSVPARSEEISHIRAIINAWIPWFSGRTHGRARVDPTLR